MADRSLPNKLKKLTSKRREKSRKFGQNWKKRRNELLKRQRYRQLKAKTQAFIQLNKLYQQKADILMFTPEQRKKKEFSQGKRRSKRAATAYVSRTWTNGVIPYIIQANFSSKFNFLLIHMLNFGIFIKRGRVNQVDNDISDQFFTLYIFLKRFLLPIVTS